MTRRLNMSKYNRNSCEDQKGKEVKAKGGQLDWHGCYRDSWKGLITDESFAHP